MTGSPADTSGPEAPVVVARARAGQGAGPTRVLLLHGLASSSTTWNGVVERVAPACEVWTADLPWRGAGVPGWWRRTPAEWAGEAVDAVPGGPDVVVAHSFGANALLSLLDTRGAEPAGSWRPPRGVVLASPFYRSTEDDFDWEAISYYLNDFDRILEDGVRVRSGGRLPQDVRHRMALKVRDRVGCYGWMRFFDSYLATPALRTSRMRMPFLLIGGGDDFSAYPRDAEALGRALPDAAVHILGGTGHFAMTERTEDFADLVNAFIHDTDAPAHPDVPLSALEYH
ncbi:alpha/beta fold hydrolase [Streptomyces sp. NPDC052042]|uniref:alpha/beta fold hydrolase n=1 Tax=Streptomyces sp. NPDC052042 TaxID=3365683 RepID=UPI0037CCCF65